MSCFFITDGDMELVSSLGTKEARKEWERIFNEHYILPVLSTLDERLMQAMDLVAADDDQQGYLINIQVYYIVIIYRLNTFWYNYYNYYIL